MRDEQAQNTLEPMISTLREKKPLSQSDPQELVHELQKISGLEIIISILLVTIGAAAIAYIINLREITTLSRILYMYSVLIAPSACLLVFLHLYNVYRTFSGKKKLIPFILDMTYLLFLLPAFLTFTLLGFIYADLDVATSPFTPGWLVALTLLFIELAVVFHVARKYIITTIKLRFPLLIHELPSKKKVLKKTVFHYKKAYIPPHPSMYYFRKKADNTRWTNNDCFIQLQKTK